MTWAVLLALLGIAVVVAAAWLLGPPAVPPSASPVPVRVLGMPTPPAARARHRPAAAGFAAQVRGYRMDQVDTVLDSLEARIAAHDRSIARLRGEAPSRRRAPPGGPTGRRDRRPAGRPCAPTGQRQGGEDDRPLDRVRQPAADDAPAAGRPVPLRRSTSGRRWPTSSRRPGCSPG